MFTGIIEERGKVLALDLAEESARLTVRGPLITADASHGDSISVSGVCLTVIERGDDWFAADVMAQTLAMSTLGGLGIGQPVNLERAVRADSRLGGHIVQGHIDGTAQVLRVTPGEAWRVLRFSVPDALASLVCAKGSIAVDGVSLTVSNIGTDAVQPHQDQPPSAENGTSIHPPADHWFEVSLIPETLTATTLGERAVGDLVNIETDILARHVERLLATRPATSGNTR